MKTIFFTLLAFSLAVVFGCSDAASRNARTTKDNNTKTTQSTGAPDTTVVVTPNEPIASPTGDQRPSTTTATTEGQSSTNGTLPEGVKEKPANELPKVEDQGKQQDNDEKANEQKKEGA
jgi:hypothetical protein